MSQFLCRVADAEGRVFSHVEPASSLEEARQKLVDRGLYVYSVESRGGRLVSLVRQKSGRQIGGSEFLILNQQFNTLIKAGLPILKSLDLLANRASSPKLRPVVSQIRDRVREGKSLSEAVAEAGVIPKFALLYRDLNVELPTPTRLLIALTVDYRFVVLGIVALMAAAATVVFLWSRTEEGGTAFDRFKFRLPVIGDTLLKFQVAQFSRTLSTLLTGGTPLVAGLQTASDAITSKLLRSTVGRATQMVREGESLHGALASKGVMPEMALDMIEVGESSGALSPMLVSVAEFYEEEVSLRLTALVSLIEPLILVFMGLLIMFILISLYLLIFSFCLIGTT